jgi:hypothetical protein
VSEVIAIPTHVSGARFLESLLASFGAFARHPMLVVVTGYEPAHEETFGELLARFRALPLTMLTSAHHFNFGALYEVYRRTAYEEIFLLPNSCQIIDPALFDLVFERHRGHSVALALMDGVAGPFWHSEIGKYRRAILDRISLLERYLPETALQAVETEMLFTARYHALDPDTAVLFPDWVDGNCFEEICGERRMRIANRYIIKWKGHWSFEMAAAHQRR